MKTAIQQEVLLMTGTSFSSRQCLQKKEGNQQCLSEAEQLCDACYNGLLPQMLPEVYSNDPSIFLWKINENKSCIEIELGELPEIMEKHLSIDPYSFFFLQKMN